MGELAELKRIPRLTVGQIKRFWLYVNRTNTCWEWKSAIHKDRGYGLFGMYSKIYYAHRVAYAIENGDIPNDGYILHICDNRLCVRPTHLYAGTLSDNMRDKMISFNQPGQRIGVEDIPVIRERLKTEKSKDIAEDYGVWPSQISRIKLGQRWGWV